MRLPSVSKSFDLNQEILFCPQMTFFKIKVFFFRYMRIPSVSKSLDLDQEILSVRPDLVQTVKQMSLAGKR